MSCASRVQFSTQWAVQCGYGDKLLLYAVVTADMPPSCLGQCELTVNSEALRGGLDADKVAGSTCVLPGIIPSGRIDDQRAA